MDVITIFRPENAQFPARGVAAPSSRVAEGGIELSAPFPYVFLFALAILFSLAPLIQGKYGWYRLEPIAFGLNESEAALKGSVYGSFKSSTGDSDAAATLPAMVRSVSFTDYKVRSGDTITTIASRFGLKNISSILGVNGVENAKRIRVGQILKIPSMDGIHYTTVRGDSLEGLAKQYSMSVTMLLDANDLETSVLPVGKTLFIPGLTLSTMDLRKAMGELFIMPLSNGRLTSRFGYRKDPFTGARSFHTGIDLAAPTGTPIQATLDGTVAATGYSTVYGNYIIVTHEHNYQSLYAHLSSFSVKRGQAVSQGMIIAKVGNTGYSTGPHLHFSVYKNGQVVDPYSVLN